MKSIYEKSLLGACMALFVLPVVWAGLSQDPATPNQATAPSDGPTNQGPAFPRQDGNAAAGKEVFRFETFGNEGFWTDAVRLPAGMKAAKVTPLQALQLGLCVDVDAVDPDTQKELVKQLKADSSGKNSALLNDPSVTEKLIASNAVIGFAAKGEKVGAACALCHTVTDGSVFNLPQGGSIGHRIDGLTNHNLNLGAIFAAAANSRALYPLLQLELKANGGKTLGRAPKGITEESTEAEVDAYLSNPKYYPVGMFDDSPDGNGDPMHITPLFRQDLAAPYGSEGLIARLDNFSNLVYTGLFDLTNLTTPGGREFLHTLGGAAGDEIADSYVKVLAATEVKGYPYVKAAPHAKPGSEEAFLGLRVDNVKLLDLNAYLASLPAPAGAKGDAKLVAQGRELFRTVGCTSCHNVDQSKRVPSFMVPMKKISPGDNPIILAERKPPLNPVQDTPGVFFDDKMAVVNASVRGEVRGTAMPLLLDLARKPVFLHDNSVASLEDLLDPKRGKDAPHPFYLPDNRKRTAVVEFLKSLGTSN
jgi:cytochrome c2